MSTPLLLAAYCVIVVLASLIGGWVSLSLRLGHRAMQLVLSAVGGFILGVAMLHLLPHAVAAAPAESVAVWMLAGLLLMFLLQRFFAFHDHEPAQPDHESTDAAGHAPPDLTWTGVAIGMSLHAFINGIALATAVLAERADEPEMALAGLAVFLVTVLHQPLDSLTVLTLAKKSGLSNKAGHVLNVAFSLNVPLGAAVAAVGLNALMQQSPQLLGFALAFAAGTFLCISLSDLLPELHFHRHDRAGLTAALVLGVALAWGIGVLEHAGHDHSEHDHEMHLDHPTHPGHDDHAGHNH